MKTVKTVSQLQQALQTVSGNVGFVPTMGALHSGHMSLVSQAKVACKMVVVSVFVNPTQFNDPNDLKKYPRTLEADQLLLERAGCDILFAPTVDEIYPNDYICPDFDLKGLDKPMEGSSRPGHFAGVVQVVNRLFDIVEPDKAFFGEKDFQQLAIIRQMEQQRGDGVEIVGCPIVRGDDGLALSSRNALLTSKARCVAPQIYKAIEKASRLTGDTAKIIAQTKELIEMNELLKVVYLEIVDKKSLQKVDVVTKNCQLCVAVMCDSVRLIDNIAMIG